MDVFSSLPDLPPRLPWFLALVLGIAWILVSIAWLRARGRPSRNQKRRARIARRAETDAERLLEAAGFDIVERQLSQRWDLLIDHRRQEVVSRVDLLLEKEGRFFVADVKTGRQAPDPRQPATRRQLLEYLLVFEADGALVVDMESRTLRAISFPGLLGWHEEWETTGP